MTRRPVAHGFALILVLWVVAGLSVVAATVSQNANQAAQAARTFADRAAAERAFANTRAQLLFTLATSGSSARGRTVGSRVLRVDGNAYAAGPDDWVAIQDARGLLNLNRLNPERGRALLLHCGAEAKQIDALLDALADYTDADDFKRTNGAEAAQYREAGLPPPANRALLSTDELWQVLGWANLRSSWVSKGCDDHVAVSAEFGFNYTSASALTLQFMGFEPAVAAALVAERNQGDDQAQVLANNVASFSLSDNPFTATMLARPGSTYRVRHWHSSGASLQYWVVLPNQRAEPPWVLLNHQWGWGPTWAAPLATAPGSRAPQALPVRNAQDNSNDAIAPPPISPI
jgi:hypothetical protein